MAYLSRGYLVLYNSAMCAGWILVMLRLLQALVEDPYNLPTAYNSFHVPLKIFQSGALLEIVHSFSGLVRAPLATTFIQVGSRIMLLWGVLDQVPELRLHQPFFVLSMVAAWAFTEIPRYAYFAYSVALGNPPYWLAWLRYSTFIPLYPVGASSEWLLLFRALPYIKARQILSIFLPNAANFSFDFHLLGIINLVLYIPGLPHMYAHMMRQRRKHLAASRPPSFQPVKIA